MFRWPIKPNRKHWRWILGAAAFHALLLVSVPMAPTARVAQAGPRGPLSITMEPLAATEQHTTAKKVPVQPKVKTVVQTSEQKSEIPQTTEPVPLAPSEFESDNNQFAGTTKTTASENDKALSDYLAQLRQAVSDHNHYPYAAKVRQQSGVVILKFQLANDGRLSSAPQVVESSGFSRLDKAAVEAILASAPFTPPPTAVKPWQFTLPVRFELN